MGTIDRPGSFKRDYKHQAKGQHRADHDLTGDWIGHRECHTKPDLLLIYCKSGDDNSFLFGLGRQEWHDRLEEGQR